MRQLGVSLNLAQRATASGARMFEILDREPRIVAPAGAPPLPPGAGACGWSTSRSPTASGQPILRDIDIDVPEGTTVALVGATGSGKSTLVQLLPRLYDPTVGRVLIDGADVREVDVRSLRARDRRRRRRPVPVLGHRGRQHRLRAAGRVARGDRARRRARPGRRLHRRAAGRLRHARGRARADAVGRPAPADRDRAGAAGRPAHPRSSTTRPRRWTPRPSSRSRPRCARSWPGRTTFVIAHRLSTIALADDIVVLEHGQIAARGNHDGAARALAALRRDRGQGPPRPGLPHPEPTGAQGGGPVKDAPTTSSAAWRADLGPRDASCAASSSCCGPTAAARR